MSPIKAHYEDLGVDGLRSNIVALDLNVDNHITNDFISSQDKLNYSLSGAISMTPNPRTEYKSPRARFSERRGGFPRYKKSGLNSKICFEQNINAPSPSFDIPYQQNFDNSYQQSFAPPGLQYEMEPPQYLPPSYSNPQLQQIILPNGMAAMVVPMSMYDMGNDRQMKKNYHRGNYQKNYGQPRKPKYKPRPTVSKMTTTISVDVPLETFKGKVYTMSQDQNGCRYLQQKIETNGTQAVDFILTEVSEKYQELMLDAFGNYLFQKLIERVSSEKRLEMLKKIEPILVDAAINLHGTRSVQKFVEVCSGSKSQTQILIDSLKGQITKLSMDTNGNHVVQRCLQHFSSEQRKFVHDTILRDMLQITKHRHGCCVFQRCIDASDDTQKKQLIEKVVSNIKILVTDPFANYVVQYVLDRSEVKYTDQLISQLLGNLPQLSIQKFSSNVIEKCLIQASQGVKNKIIEEITNCATLKSLLHDQYANYVIQQALTVSDNEQGHKLVQNIVPHLSELANFNPTCARRVAGKALKRFPNLYSDPRIAVHAVLTE